jgi:hypothetical protein
MVKKRSRVNRSTGLESRNSFQCQMPFVGYSLWVNIKLGANSFKGSKRQSCMLSPLFSAVWSLQPSFPSLLPWSKLCILVSLLQSVVVVKSHFAVVF